MHIKPVSIQNCKYPSKYHYENNYFLDWMVETYHQSFGERHFTHEVLKSNEKQNMIKVHNIIGKAVGTIFTSNFPLGYLQHFIYNKINVQRRPHAFSSFQMASLVPRAGCRTKAEWLSLVAVACIAGPRPQSLSRHSAVPTGPVRMDGFVLRGSSSQSEAVWIHFRTQSNGSLVQFHW